MRRRDFIAVVSGAAAWPLAARAQQPAIPVIAFLDAAPLETDARGLAEFSKGLSEIGYVESAFAPLVERGAAALLIEGDPFFIGRMKQLVVLTARHAIPAIYQSRDFPEAGGLMSYGADRSAALRLAGGYTGRILKGERPLDLPVQLATKLELIINLDTAKALRIDVPPTLLARADEVIE